MQLSLHKKMTFPRRLQTIVLVVAILAITILPYAQVLTYDFVWDDGVFVVKNNALNQLSPISRFFTDAETLSSHYDYNRWIYRPLRTLTYALLYQAAGLSPVVFHLANLVLHLFCTLLVFLILRRSRLGHRLAVVAAILFGVHPAHTEAVTWISSLGDVMSSFWYLLAFYFFMSSRATSKGLAILLFFPLALVSKEMAITLPAGLFVWRLFEHRTGRHPIVRTDLVWLGIAMVIAAVYFFWRAHVLGQLGQSPISAAYLLRSTQSLPLVIYQYLDMIVWPFKLNSLRTPIRPDDVHVAFYIFFVLITLALPLAAVTAYVKRRFWGAWLAWCLVTMLPIYNFIPINIQVAERFIYLPSVAIIALLVWGGTGVLTHLSKRHPHAIWTGVSVGLAAVCVIVCVIATCRRNTTWKNNRTVFAHQIMVPNPAYNAYWNLATTVDTYDQAIAVLTEAVEGKYDIDRFRDALCQWNVETGKFKEARRHGKRSLELNEENWGAHLCLGAAAVGEDRLDDAERHYTAALALNPKSSDAHMGLGNVYFRRGDPRRAASHLEQALALFPENPDILVGLIHVYRALGDHDKEREAHRKWQLLEARNQQAQKAGRAGRYF